MVRPREEQRADRIVGISGLIVHPHSTPTSPRCLPADRHGAANRCLDVEPPALTSQGGIAAEVDRVAVCVCVCVCESE